MANGQHGEYRYRKARSGEQDEDIEISSTEAVVNCLVKRLNTLRESVKRVVRETMRFEN